MVLSQSVEVIFVLLGTIGLKALISTALGTQDDVGVVYVHQLCSLCNLTLPQTHIRDLLWSKVTSYVDFYTQLYTCAPEFDTLPLSYVVSTSSTLLLPASCLTVVLMGIKVARRLLEVGRHGRFGLCAPVMCPKYHNKYL